MMVHERRDGGPFAFPSAPFKAAQLIYLVRSHAPPSPPYVTASGARTVMLVTTLAQAIDEVGAADRRRWPFGQLKVC